MAIDLPETNSDSIWTGGRDERARWKLPAGIRRADCAGRQELRREIVDPTIAEHNGRIVKTTGDGMLVEFASTVDALTCAVTVQKMAEREPGSRHEIAFRVGINVGDIIVDGEDIIGDGVAGYQVAPTSN